MEFRRLKRTHRERGGRSMFRRIYLLAWRALILGTLVSVARADSHIASPANQRFHQGDISSPSTTAVNAATVFFSCEAGDVGGGTGNHVPIIVSAPAGVNFDQTAPLPTTSTVTNSISPPSQGVLGAVSFLDATHLNIAMGTNFKPGDNFTLSGLRFTNLTPGSVPDFLRESVNNQTSYGYIDSFSVRVANNPIAAPATGPGVSQVISPGGTSVPCNSITITDPTSSPPIGGIWATTGIMITIPSGLGVTWDNTATTLTGPINPDVSSTVGYTDFIGVNQPLTAVIGIIRDFTPSEAVILNGLKFNVATNAADNPGFQLNIRIGGVNNNQPFHAQCGNIQIAGVPHISSAANQTFTVGDLPASATQGGPITITETSGTPKMTAPRHVQVVIPSGLKCGWNPLFTPTTSVTGTGVVGTATIITTSQSNDTLDIPVTTSFSSNDQLFINAAQFSSFSQRSGPASLQLFVTGTSFNPQPTDPRTQAIGQPTMSSQNDQDFLVSPPNAVLMAPITITDDATTPRLTGGSAISI